MSANDIWYYARSDGSAVGPLSRLDMIKLARDGVISTETLVWDNDSFDWRSFGKTPIAIVTHRDYGGEAAAGWVVDLAQPVAPPPSAPSAPSASVPPQRRDSGQQKRQRRATLERSRAERRHELKQPATAPRVAPGVTPAASVHAGPAVGDRFGWAVRRWCARLFDICSAGLLALAALLLIAHRLDPSMAKELSKLLSEPFLVAPAAMLAWIPFEALAISLFGTTPGKALWGIRLGAIEAATLGPISSLQRSISVVLRGMFIGIPPMTLLAQGWAMLTVINKGETSWDHSSGTIVEYRSLSGQRIMIGLVLLVAAVVGVINGETWRWVQALASEVASTL